MARTTADQEISLTVEMAQLRSRPEGRDAGGHEVELSDAELEDARRGFEQYLRIKRFPRRFIAEHGDDLMARARFELARGLERGDHIDDPPAWLINCAYRRAQNFLTSKSREPDFVALDAVAAVVPDDDDTPEDAALDHDRERKVREAVSRLTVEERKLVALEFFEGLPLARCARELGWKESKARLRHESAMERLHALLGVDSSDQIVIDVAAAAWAAEAFGRSFEVNVSAEVTQRVTDLAQSAFDHTPEPVRRLVGSGGADPASAAAAGNVARTAGGVCAAAVCLYAGAASVGLAPVPTQTDSGNAPAPRAAGKGAVHVPQAAESVVPPGLASANAGRDGTRARAAATSSSAGVGESAPAHASQPPLPDAEAQADQVFHSFDGAATPASGSSEGSTVRGAEPSAGASASEQRAQEAFRSFER